MLQQSLECNVTGLNKDAIHGCITANGSFASDTSLCATFDGDYQARIAGFEGTCEWEEKGAVLSGVLHCPVGPSYGYALFAALVSRFIVDVNGIS